MKTLLNITCFCFALLFSNCTDTSSNKLYQKRLEEAKWDFYKWNFTIRKKIVCKDGFRDTNSSLCFIEGLKIDTFNIGDTLEITILATHKDKNAPCFCLGLNYVIFGFFPNADTVTYKVPNGAFVNHPRRDYLKPVPDSIYKKEAWMGVHSPKEEDKLFREFLKQNVDKLNPWLKEEAKKRGYIN